MAYIAANVKEDAQDDTLRFLAACIWSASDAIRRRDPEKLFTECNIAYMTFKGRLDKDHVAESEAIRERIRNLLYSPDRLRGNKGMSKALNEGMKWYEVLCDDLSKKGILLRLQSNLDEVAFKRGGM